MLRKSETELVKAKFENGAAEGDRTLDLSLTKDAVRLFHVPPWPAKLHS